MDNGNMKLNREVVFNELSHVVLKFGTSFLGAAEYLLQLQAV